MKMVEIGRNQLVDKGNALLLRCTGGEEMVERIILQLAHRL